MMVAMAADVRVILIKIAARRAPEIRLLAAALPPYRSVAGQFAWLVSVMVRIKSTCS